MWDSWQGQVSIQPIHFLLPIAIPSMTQRSESRSQKSRSVPRIEVGMFRIRSNSETFLRASGNKYSVCDGVFGVAAFKVTFSYLGFGNKIYRKVTKIIAEGLQNSVQFC
jgi:hypothetical protein